MSTCIAIDLKSYYASAECAARHLDPLTTNLVVADPTRTEKTICLAVSPSLKAYGISGRARLFEVVEAVRKINDRRLADAVRLGAAVYRDGRPDFYAESFDAKALATDPSLKLSFITATPRMAYYLRTSADIYRIYRSFIAEEDLLVYSVDEVFIDATGYLRLYGLSARDLAKSMIREVLYRTGITATAGIGPNLYLAKIAMDIVAKHIPADGDGVRIAEIDETGFRTQLWDHRPLTDFWGIGPGKAARLGRLGIATMGDLARKSIEDEDALFRAFGIDAEIMIDHAWGLEPCGMKEIKAYRPQDTSFSEGQVLAKPTPWREARLIIAEMADTIVFRLTESGTMTDGIQIWIGYDGENVRNGTWRGPAPTDHYGRPVPPGSGGTVRLGHYTLLGSEIVPAVLRAFDALADPALTIRRLGVVAVRLRRTTECFQMELFGHPERDRKERNLQEALLDVRKRYGRNMMLKGRDFLEGATIRQRNTQIGGHRA